IHRCRYCPLATSLKLMAVLRFLIFSLSSFRLLSKDSSMPIISFDAQSLLKVLLISDMELKVILWPKMFFSSLRKVDCPVLFSLEIRLRIGGFGRDVCTRWSNSQGQVPVGRQIYAPRTAL